MFIASKIILKSALLAAGAATPFIAAGPTGNGSAQPAFPRMAAAAPTAPESRTLPYTWTAPSAPGLPGTLTTPNAPYITIPPLTPGAKAPKQLSLVPRTMPDMTNIPKSYEIYLLYRSDGVLIGPNGVVPLKPSLPKNILVEPGKKP